MPFTDFLILCTLACSHCRENSCLKQLRSNLMRYWWVTWYNCTQCMHCELKINYTVSCLCISGLISNHMSLLKQNVFNIQNSQCGMLTIYSSHSTWWFIECVCLCVCACMCVCISVLFDLLDKHWSKNAKYLL